MQADFAREHRVGSKNPSRVTIRGLTKSTERLDLTSSFDPISIQQ